MANRFAVLPVPAGNGSGAAIDVSLMGANKTVVVCGSFTASLNIEVSPDGVIWGPLIGVTGCGVTEVQVACAFMRVRVSGYAGGSADCGVGGDDSGSQTETMNVPAGNGVGTTLDASALGPIKTFFVNGTFSGQITVEISNDGTAFAPLIGFSNPDRENARATAKFMRIRRSGVGTPAGLPTVNVSGAFENSGGADNIGPGNFRIYARTTGSDTLGDGTLANPYRTFQRAVLDVPAEGPLEDGQNWFIDITDLGLENLPDGYRLPLWQSNGPDFVSDFTQPYPPFQFIVGRVNIEAVPTLVLAIPAANIVSQVADPTTGLLVITVTDVLVVNAHQGQLLIDQTAFLNAVIVENGVNTLSISTTIPYAGASMDIMTPSAELGSATGTNFDGLGVYSSSAPIAFSGIKLSNSAGGGTSALRTADASGVYFVLCDINGLHTSPISRQLAWFSCFLRNKNFELRATLSSMSFCGGLGTNFARVSAAGDLGAGGGFGNYFLNPSNIGHAFEPADYSFVYFNYLIKNAGGNGIVFAGGSASRAELCDIQGSAGDGILAIGPGLLYVENCAGSGNTGFGVNIRNGAQIKGLAANALTGVGGDVKVGAQAVSTWAAIPAGGIFDEGLAGSTGARVMLSTT